MISFIQKLVIIIQNLLPLIFAATNVKAKDITHQAQGSKWQINIKMTFKICMFLDWTPNKAALNVAQLRKKLCPLLEFRVQNFGPQWQVIKVQNYVLMERIW